MSKSNIEIRAERAEHLMEKLNSVFLGFIPGGHTAEAFLNYRDELKTKRVLKFLEGFSIALQEIAEEREIDVSVFTSEDFIDVFDSIIAKVQTTKSNIKIERFKNILLKQTVQNTVDQMMVKYINLLNDLNEIQIILLEILSKEKSAIDFFAIVSKCINKQGFVSMTNVNTLVEFNLGTVNINIDTDTIQFLLNDLETKGLFNNEVIETSREKVGFLSLDKGEKIYSKKLYKLSSVGIEFLNLIKQ
jgi:hypothetical protein